MNSEKLLALKKKEMIITLCPKNSRENISFNCISNLKNIKLIFCDFPFLPSIESLEYAPVFLQREHSYCWVIKYADEEILARFQSWDIYVSIDTCM